MQTAPSDAAPPQAPVESPSSVASAAATADPPPSDGASGANSAEPADTAVRNIAPAAAAASSDALQPRPITEAARAAALPDPAPVAAVAEPSSPTSDAPSTPARPQFTVRCIRATLVGESPARMQLDLVDPSEPVDDAQRAALAAAAIEPLLPHGRKRAMEHALNEASLPCVVQAIRAFGSASTVETSVPRAHTPPGEAFVSFSSMHWYRMTDVDRLRVTCRALLRGLGVAFPPRQRRWSVAGGRNHSPQRTVGCPLWGFLMAPFGFPSLALPSVKSLTLELPYGSPLLEAVGGAVLHKAAGRLSPYDRIYFAPAPAPDFGGAVVRRMLSPRLNTLTHLEYLNISVPAPSCDGLFGRGALALPRLERLYITVEALVAGGEPAVAEGAFTQCTALQELAVSVRWSYAESAELPRIAAGALPDSLRRVALNDWSDRCVLPAGVQLLHVRRTGRARAVSTAAVPAGCTELTLEGTNATLQAGDALPPALQHVSLKCDVLSAGRGMLGAGLASLELHRLKGPLAAGALPTSLRRLLLHLGEGSTADAGSLPDGLLSLELCVDHDSARPAAVALASSLPASITELKLHGVPMPLPPACLPNTEKLWLSATCLNDPAHLSALVRESPRLQELHLDLALVIYRCPYWGRSPAIAAQSGFQYAPRDPSQHGDPRALYVGALAAATAGRTVTVRDEPKPVCNVCTSFQEHQRVCTFSDNSFSYVKDTSSSSWNLEIRSLVVASFSQPVAGAGAASAGSFVDNTTSPRSYYESSDDRGP